MVVILLELRANSIDKTKPTKKFIKIQGTTLWLLKVIKYRVKAKKVKAVQDNKVINLLNNQNKVKFNKKANKKTKKSGHKKSFTDNKA